MQPGLNTDPHGVNSFPSPSLTASLTSKHGFNIKGRVRDHTSTSSCPRLQTATPWSSQTGELHQLYDSERCVSTGAQNEKEKFIFWFIFVNHCWHWMCEAEVPWGDGERRRPAPRRLQVWATARTGEPGRRRECSHFPRENGFNLKHICSFVWITAKCYRELNIFFFQETVNSFTPQGQRFDSLWGIKEKLNLHMYIEVWCLVPVRKSGWCG